MRRHQGIQVPVDPFTTDGEVHQNALHSRVQSSTTVKQRKRQPPCNWSLTKSRDQRRLRCDGAGNGNQPVAARRSYTERYRGVPRGSFNNLVGEDDKTLTMLLGMTKNRWIMKIFCGQDIVRRVRRAQSAQRNAGGCMRQKIIYSIYIQLDYLSF